MPDPIKLQENVSLAPLTTLKVGGPARFFVQADTERQVVAAFDHASKSGLEVLILGGGSNVLISDQGFYGLVIRIGLKGIVEEGEVRSVAAGEDWDAFVSSCVDRELAGVECLSGIPGLVGGTPVQNVGAYGQEVSETIQHVRCFDRQSGEIRQLSNAECGFTYRKSIFNSSHRDRYVVLSVSYRLVCSGRAKIAYKDLKDHFGDRGASLQGVRNAVLSIRRAKSMVIDEKDPNSRSAGSFFKNPIIDTARLSEIEARAEGVAVPRYPAGDGNVKLPAAWLIEQAGFHKGFRLGNAGISTNHSLAIVNVGGATTGEILSLKEKIQDSVVRKFDILLEPEPVFVGFN